MATRQVDEIWWQKMWAKASQKKKMEAYDVWLWGYLRPGGTSWKKGLSEVLADPKFYGIDVGMGLRDYIIVLNGKPHFNWDLKKVFASDQYKILLAAQTSNA